MLGLCAWIHEGWRSVLLDFDAAFVGNCKDWSCMFCLNLAVCMCGVQDVMEGSASSAVLVVLACGICQGSTQCWAGRLDLLLVFLAPSVLLAY